MRSRQVACLGSCVYSLPCTLTYTSRLTPDMLVCLQVLGTAVLWGRPWGWGARAAGARAGAAARPPVACTSVGCRGPGGCLGARGLAKNKTKISRIKLKFHWGRTHHLVFDKCQPGVYYLHGDIITPSWILRDSPVGIMERKLMSLYDPHI